MSRSIYKGPYVCKSIITKVQTMLAKNIQRNVKPIRVYKRAAVILQSFVGLSFEVHNGHRFIKIYVIEQMVGHRFGEFAATRKAPKHSGKKISHMLRRPKQKK